MWGEGTYSRPCLYSCSCPPESWFYAWSTFLQRPPSWGKVSPIASPGSESWSILSHSQTSTHKLPIPLASVWYKHGQKTQIWPMNVRSLLGHDFLALKTSHRKKRDLSASECCGSELLQLWGRKSSNLQEDRARECRKPDLTVPGFLYLCTSCEIR